VAPFPAARSYRRRGGGRFYAVIVRDFSGYSWPVTVAVVVLGCLLVAIAWRGPVRSHPALAGRTLRRAWLWALVLVAGGGWELSSLLQQPHLTTESDAPRPSATLGLRIVPRISLMARHHSSWPPGGQLILVADSARQFIAR
jgi:hypothetical protein